MCHDINLPVLTTWGAQPPAWLQEETQCVAQILSVKTRTKQSYLPNKSLITLSFSSRPTYRHHSIVPTLKVLEWARLYKRSCLRARLSPPPPPHSFISPALYSSLLCWIIDEISPFKVEGIGSRWAINIKVDDKQHTPTRLFPYITLNFRVSSGANRAVRLWIMRLASLPACVPAC